MLIIIIIIYTCRGIDAPGSVYKFVTDSLLLPKSTAGPTYTYDYVGDGRPVNQFKNLVNVISLSGLDIQAEVNAAVAAGTTIELASITTNDLGSSTCAGVTLIPAQPPMSMPKFDGSDVFSKAMAAEASLIGQISTGYLSTKASKDLLPTEDSPAEVRLGVGGMALVLPMHGLHIEATVDNGGTPIRLRSGKLHGVIAAADIDAILFPAMAIQLTNLIHMHTTVVMGVPTPDDTAKAIIGLFEQRTGSASKAKCMANPADCCGFPGMAHPDTCKIVPQEVKDSAIGGVLAPDVEVFDGGGHWKPVPGGKSPNGMSLGIGFTGVTASFP